MRAHENCTSFNSIDQGENEIVILVRIVVLTLLLHCRHSDACSCATAPSMVSCSCLKKEKGYRQDYRQCNAVNQFSSRADTCRHSRRNSGILWLREQASFRSSLLLFKALVRH
jgi:hypothetical protein